MEEFASIYAQTHVSGFEERVKLLKKKQNSWGHLKVNENKAFLDSNMLFMYENDNS